MAPTAPSAALVFAAVHPVHHFTSAVVPGPNLASQRRTSSLRASSAGMDGTPPGSHVAIGDHRYWLLVQEPFGRPRATRWSVERRNSTRVDMPMVPAQFLPSP